MSSSIHYALKVYQDPEVLILKMELRGLEQVLARLNDERDEYQHTVTEFNLQYSLHLDDLISKILRLKMMTAYRRARQRDMNPEEKKKRFEEKIKARATYERYHGEHDDEPVEAEPRDLTPDEAERMKIAYRRASRLCHPDMVAADLKERATQQFQALHEAYRNNDLDLVEAILLELESGGVFMAASDQMHDKEKLRAHIVILRRRIQDLEKEAEEMREDATWQLIKDMQGDYRAFFAEQTEQLRQERSRLWEEYQGMGRIWEMAKA